MDMPGEENLLVSEGVADDILRKRGGTGDAGRDRTAGKNEYLGLGGAWAGGAGVDDE